MKEKRILHVLGEINDSYIEELYADSGNKAGKNRHSRRKLWLIAAVVALMVFLMGSAIVEYLSMPECPMFDYPLTDSAKVPAENIHLTVSDVSATSMQLFCSIDGVEAGQDAIYILSGGPFTIEKKTESGWEELPAVIDAPGRHPDEVLTEGTYDWHIDWSAVYGILDNGEYRLTTTVLEGNVPVSVEFEVKASESDVSVTVEKLLSGEAYYIRYFSTCEFGSFDNVTNQKKKEIKDSAKSSEAYVHEYWKCGDDLMSLIYRDDKLWIGLMYKDGTKYSLEHEGDDRNNPIIGWTPMPDLDLNRLTEWTGIIDDSGYKSDVVYRQDETVERIVQVGTFETFQDYYDVETTITHTFEIVSTETRVCAEQFAKQNVDTAQEFSWEEDRVKMRALEVSFVNTTTEQIDSASEAISRASAECTVEYNKIMVYRDEEAGMWKVEFQILYGYQGYQFVYLNDEGITQLVSGAGSKVPEWQDDYPGPQ